jgi:signal transduction histidine kinase
VVVKPDGTLLFATLGGGLSSYRPDRHPPQTYVGSHASGGARGAPSSVVQGEDLVLPFSGQDVLKDTRTGDLLFSYRVDGGAWSAFSPSTRAWMAGLEPGTHLFEVRAMDRDLNVDPTPARHRFRVLRPWWAQPWLIGLVGLSLALLIYALVRITRAIARERGAVLQEQATVNERRQFVRLASHELRKPLARMAHRSEVLALPATLEQRDKIAEYAEAIVSDSNHLSRLVETLLEQARIQEGGLQLALQDGDLGELVKKLVGELVESSDGRVGPASRTASEPLIVRYDPFYLPLALRNLLDNACKYGGGVDAVEVECTVENGRAAVKISDRGPGIAEQDRQRIFEPFFRGRNRPEHGGFGLGLSFARDIARAHGGDLELVADHEGEGATFRLWLPLERERMP